MTVRTRRIRVTALVVVLALLAACGGGKDDGGGGDDESDGPVRGGTVRFGLEAETGGGWCLQESQLAISGITVARAVYDTLTMPNSEGEYVPYLAESVTPNDDYTEWVITIRDGVTFHDGTPLTAEVVKNNLDAYRGAPGEHARSPLLFLFVLQNVDTVEVTGERDVTVTTKVPWVAFPAFLFSSGRLGITAQAQLDDEEGCPRNLIGTGPFKLEDPSDWIENREIALAANEDYWQEAPDGEPYPYLDELIFEPIVEGEQRLNALESDDIQMAHYSASDEILRLRELTEAGTLDSYESTANAEVGFLQLNTSRPPLDDVRIRQAIALAIDPADYREVINDGVQEPANGPFAPGSTGHVDDSGFPQGPDQEQAEALIAEYEEEVGPLRTLGYLYGPTPAGQEQAVYVQQALQDVGFEIELETAQQTAVIDRAISGDFDIQPFRNYPGGDPDLLYNWFQSESPVNFTRMVDEEVDRLLDEARSEPDAAARAELYEQLNQRMGEQAYSTWLNYTTWVVGASPDVHGFEPDSWPQLPDDGGSYDEGLAVGFPSLGIWTTAG